MKLPIKMNPKLKKFIKRGLEGEFDEGHYVSENFYEFTSEASNAGPQHNYMDVGFRIDEDGYVIEPWNFYERKGHKKVMNKYRKMFLEFKEGIYLVSYIYDGDRNGHVITVRIDEHGDIHVFDSAAYYLYHFINLAKIWNCYSSETITHRPGRGQVIYEENIYSQDGRKRLINYYGTNYYQYKTHDGDCIVWSLCMAVLFDYFRIFGIEFQFPGEYYSANMLEYMRWNHNYDFSV